MGIEVLTKTTRDSVKAEKFFQDAAEKANKERKRISSTALAAQGDNIIAVAVLEPV